MKRFLFILVIFIACKPDGGGNSNKLEIKVREAVTGTPVEGVSVKLFKCNLGCPFGATKLFDGLTDSKGSVFVDADDYTNASGGMSIDKLKYWAYAPTKNTTVFMVPEGWMRIRIVKTGSYPADASFKMVINPEASEPKLLSVLQYNMAADSIILVRAYGAQLNKIDWQVSGNSLYNSGTFNQQIPKFDTVKNITISY